MCCSPRYGDGGRFYPCGLGQVVGKDLREERREWAFPALWVKGACVGGKKNLTVRPLEASGESTPRFVNTPDCLIEPLSDTLQLARSERRYRRLLKSYQPHLYRETPYLLRSFMPHHPIPLNP